MGLNIKRPEAEEAIRELAALDGVSLTDAVETAVREALATRKSREVDAERRRRFAEFRAFLGTLPPAPPQPPGARSNHDELYGDDGLPA